MNFKQISIIGVIAGGLLAWVSSFCIGAMLGLALMLISPIYDTSSLIEKIQTPPGSLYFMAIMVMIGCSIGGFITGLISKRAEILNAAIAGIGVVIITGGSHVANDLLTIPFFMLGGYLGLKRNLSNQAIERYGKPRQKI